MTRQQLPRRRRLPVDPAAALAEVDSLPSQWVDHVGGIPNERQPRPDVPAFFIRIKYRF